MHDGSIEPPAGGRFERLLVIGIGGSALGPQFVADALGGRDDRMRPAFLDNTDPDGIERSLAALGDQLASTLVVVISKSGGTPETRNGMLETRAAFEARGLAFGRQAVAVTGPGASSTGSPARKGSSNVSRCGTGSAAGPRRRRSSGCCPPRSRASTSTPSGRRRRDGRGDPGRDLRANPAAMLAWAWHHEGKARAPRTW